MPAICNSFYPVLNVALIQTLSPRPVARINFGEVRNPQNVDFLNLPTPLTLLQTPHSFLAHFVTKSGPISRFGLCVTSPHPLTTRPAHCLDVDTFLA